MIQYFTLLPLLKNDLVFDVGESSEFIYVIVSGEVGIYDVGPIWGKLKWNQRKRLLSSHPTMVFHDWEIKQRCRFGSMIGELSHVLQERRVFAAKCERETCLFALSRKKFQEMEVADPALAIGLLKMIGRSLGLTLLNVQSLTEQHGTDI